MIRRICPEDAAAITEILSESPEAANWTADSFADASRTEGVIALGSETDGRLGGFIVARQMADEGEVLNLAIRREGRRKGEGGGLLKAALAELKASGVTHVYLEVRESNVVATAFYEGQGFTRTGVRKGYYRNPEEAAVLLERKLTA